MSEAAVQSEEIEKVSEPEESFEGAPTLGTADALAQIEQSLRLILSRRRGKDFIDTTAALAGLHAVEQLRLQVGQS